MNRPIGSLRDCHNSIASFWPLMNLLSRTTRQPRSWFAFFGDPIWRRLKDGSREMSKSQGSRSRLNLMENLLILFLGPGCFSIEKLSGNYLSLRLCRLERQFRQGKWSFGKAISTALRRYRLFARGRGNTSKLGSKSMGLRYDFYANAANPRIVLFPGTWTAEYHALSPVFS